MSDRAEVARGTIRLEVLKIAGSWRIRALVTFPGRKSTYYLPDTFSSEEEAAKRMNEDLPKLLESCRNNSSLTVLGVTRNG